MEYAATSKGVDGKALDPNSSDDKFSVSGQKCEKGNKKASKHNMITHQGSQCRGSVTL